MNVSPAPPALRNIVPPGYRLRLPGPAAVPERVRAAIAQPVLNHRGPEFRSVLGECGAALRRIFGTRRDVLLFGSSGTGAMEAALANVLEPGNDVLVVENGQFGERFAAIAETMGARVDRLEVPWGEAPDPAAIAARLRTHDYRAVVCVHNESSTGVVADLAGIGAVVRASPALLIVDSVSGVGGVEMRMDEWGVDVLVAASQKALMCPPGLAFAALSGKAERVVDAARGVPLQPRSLEPRIGAAAELRGRARQQVRFERQLAVSGNRKLRQRVRHQTPLHRRVGWVCRQPVERRRPSGR